MTQPPIPYENNPFTITINGLELLFSKAKSVAIFFIILLGIGLLSTLPDLFEPATDATSTSMSKEAFIQKVQTVSFEMWLMIATIVVIALLVVSFIQIVISGISDYTSAKLLKNQPVTFDQALRGVFANFWGYAWVMIIVGVKTFLWSLLFIIPGFYMSFRYSLAGVSYFDKKQSGNKAVIHSLSLTKNAWLTTFAAHSLLPLLTLGVTQELVLPGIRAILYRQFSQLHDKKPAAHIFSWLTLILPFVFLALFLLFIVGIALLIMSIGQS